MFPLVGLLFWTITGVVASPISASDTASLLWVGTPKQSLFARPPITTPSACPPLARIICTQGIRSVANLLWHLPAGMVDRRQVSRVAGLVEGEIATVLLKVRSLARSLAVSTLFRAPPTCI